MADGYVIIYTTIELLTHTHTCTYMYMHGVCVHRQLLRVIIFMKAATSM